ncbi:MAG: DUF5777 family beta-barrel protein [Bacteroidetes bacterium]|nr:DUF5777 family beta-barrel protein [Bacteroidota bacterium]
MKSFFRYLIMCTVYLLVFPGIQKSTAQDLGLDDNENITNAFRSSTLINAQTTVVQPAHSFEFSIRHRFGEMELNKDAIKNFLGLDLFANIRFGFDFSVMKNLQVGAGRTKNGKMYDAELKQLLLTQSTDPNVPVSVSVYLDAAVNTDDFLPVPRNAYFDNGVTPFRYKFNHRLSYNSQVIISRKFCDWFSFEVSPALIYKNLASAGTKNHTIVLPVGGAIKTGMNSSFLFEYAYRFNNQPEDKLYPLSIAMEFGTVSHVFQIVVSSSQEILEQQLYTNVVSDYTKKKFLLGFNIKRTYWKKPKTKS